MAVTILECLQCGDFNLQNNGAIGVIVANAQVHNATILLEKGYDIERLVDPLIDKYGSVESVPDFVDLPEDEQKAN